MTRRSQFPTITRRSSHHSSRRSRGLENALLCVQLHEQLGMLALHIAPSRMEVQPIRSSPSNSDLALETSASQAYAVHKIPRNAHPPKSPSIYRTHIESYTSEFHARAVKIHKVHIHVRLDVVAQ